MSYIFGNIICWLAKVFMVMLMQIGGVALKTLWSLRIGNNVCDCWVDNFRQFPPLAQSNYLRWIARRRSSRPCTASATRRTPAPRVLGSRRRPPGGDKRRSPAWTPPCWCGDTCHCRSLSKGQVGVASSRTTAIHIVCNKGCFLPTQTHPHTCIYCMNMYKCARRSIVATHFSYLKSDKGVTNSLWHDKGLTAQRVCFSTAPSKVQKKIVGVGDNYCQNTEKGTTRSC